MYILDNKRLHCKFPPLRYLTTCIILSSVRQEEPKVENINSVCRRVVSAWNQSHILELEVELNVGLSLTTLKKMDLFNNVLSYLAY